MTNYKKLKQKIQEAVPSLKEFINGCIIETPHWNMFKQKYEDNLFDVYIIYFGNVYVKWEDFAEIIRFENDQITYRFITGLHDINLCNISGEYLDKKLYSMLLSDFKCEAVQRY